MTCLAISKYIKVPTGHIGVVDGSKGSLEFVSVGDYGKEKNIKADFLGLSRDIEGVPDGGTLPLAAKWVVTVSTQYGCSMSCRFCDVPKVGPSKNATWEDLALQLEAALSLNPEVTETNRLNIHFARMGEPTFNWDVLDFCAGLKNLVGTRLNAKTIHPVLSTMLPRALGLERLLIYLSQWCNLKNTYYKGEAGLQFSINSTDEAQREFLFSGNAHTLKDIAKIGEVLPPPVGRKYTLNFAVWDHAIINAETLVELFDPEKFMVKLTPIHVTNESLSNDLFTTGGYSHFYPYRAVEAQMKRVGFDTIVFVPSREEEQSRITCGNAILSGVKPIQGRVFERAQTWVEKV